MKSFDESLTCHLRSPIAPRVMKIDKTQAKYLIRLKILNIHSSQSSLETM